MADEESKTPIEPEIKLDGLAAPDAPAQSGTPAADPPAPVEVDPLDISKTPKSFGIVKMALIIMAVIVVAAAIGVYMLLKSNADSLTSSSASPTPSPTATTKPVTPAASNAGVTLDTKKNYGNKYASGVLPVGDSKYVTTGAKKGYVYVCNANYVPASQAGAQTRGPWFTNNNTEWNVNKKAAILGKVSWQPSMSVTVQDGKRVITTNDLPSHFTGTFPVASTDPARTYDANPNTIKAQSLTYTLDGAPVVQSSPNCMGGEVGVMLTGVALFNAFDAGGRDAGAWEVQDGCDGHPQNLGEYHYHTLSRCITDTSVQTVIGYALDGFPITGPKLSANNILTTSDLDECHGLTSQITVDSKKVTMYHYVMTEDFPYSVSCFKGTAVKPPGQPEARPTGPARS